MKIVLWSSSFPPALGGLERFSFELAGWLASRDHEVVVITATPAEQSYDSGALYSILRAANHRAAVRAMGDADVVQIAGASLKGIAAAWRSLSRPFVTHAGHQTVCPSGLAWTEAQVCDAGPRIGPCRGCDAVGSIGWLDVRAHRAACRIGAHDIFCSVYLRDRCGLKGEVIYNPVSAALFGQSGNLVDGELIVSAGRLVREKGFDLLIKAMVNVDGRLILAGDGPLRTYLESLANDLGAGSKVTFVGRLELAQLAELYSTAAIACIPSVWGEPFGYAVAEAMATHIPVVGTSVGAIPELLGDERGFLARTLTPRGLADSINEALNDGIDRTRRADKAFRFAREEFHVDVVGRRYEELYSK